MSDNNSTDYRINENDDPRAAAEPKAPKVPFAVRNPRVAAAGATALTGVIWAAGIATATVIVHATWHGMNKLLKPAPAPVPVASDPAAPVAAS